MKKMLVVLLCMMCIFTVGCQKKEVINSENVSGESDEKVSGEIDLKDDSYIFPNSATKKIEKNELMNLSLDNLEKAKNEIFARYGHDFSSKSLKEYFESKSWYKVVSGKKVAVSELNEIEQANVILIDRRIKELVDDANGYERQEELISMNKFSEPIKILKEISTSDIDKKYDFDWDTKKMSIHWLKNIY